MADVGVVKRRFFEIFSAIILSSDTVRKERGRKVAGGRELGGAEPNLQLVI